MPGRKGGRRPLPANVVELRGNRSKLTKEQLEARRAEELAPRPVAPRPPKDLAPLELECWKLHAPELDRLGLLTVLDAASFRMACVDYALALSALEALRWRTSSGAIDRRRKGYQVVVEDPDHGGQRRHPALMVYKQHSDSYRQWCSRFGLTPSDRVGLRPGAPVRSVETDDEEDDEFFGH